MGLKLGKLLKLILILKLILGKENRLQEELINDFIIVKTFSLYNPDSSTPEYPDSSTPEYPDSSTPEYPDSSTPQHHDSSNPQYTR